MLTKEQRRVVERVERGARPKPKRAWVAASCSTCD